LEEIVSEKDDDIETLKKQVDGAVDTSAAR